MKLILTALIITVIGFNSLAGESGPDNGTDYVKVLFAEAQSHLNQDFSLATLPTLSLAAEFRSWLEAKTSNGLNRFSGIKTYLQIMELQFQLENCKDIQARESTICFQYQSGKPVVLISVSQNRLTTSEQAMAMLIHEAGHFVGETDHLFLDRLGVALVQTLKQPALVEAQAQSTEIVANVFAAKSECESGTSDQAKSLLKQTHQQIVVLCAEKNISCPLERIESVFTGTIEFVQGQGFTMKVTCQLKSILRLQDFN